MFDETASPEEDAKEGDAPKDDTEDGEDKTGE